VNFAANSLDLIARISSVTKGLRLLAASSVRENRSFYWSLLRTRSCTGQLANTRFVEPMYVLLEVRARNVNSSGSGDTPDPGSMCCHCCDES